MPPRTPMPRRTALPAIVVLILLALGAPHLLRADPTEDALKIGMESLDKDDKQAALTTFLNAYNEAATLRVERTPTCMLLLAYGGKMLSDAGQAAPAALCFERLYSISVELNGNTHPHTILTAVHLAHYLGRAGQSMDRARRLLQEALIAYRQHPEGLPAYLPEFALFTYADILLAQKERIAATSIFRDYIKLAEARPNPDHAKISEVYLKLAGIDAFFGRATDAEKKRQIALTHMQKARGDKHFDVLSMRLGLCDQLPAKDAIAALKDVVRDLAGVKGIETDKKCQQLWCVAEFRLALREAELNQRDGLVARLKSAIAHGILGYGEDHEQLLQLYLELAKLHLSKNQNREGVECYRHVLAIRIKALGPDHESVLTTQKILDDLIADLRKNGENI